ncbi:MAG: hypothetical protein WA061_00820 [Microgenomates group bacterium]
MRTEGSFIKKLSAGVIALIITSAVGLKLASTASSVEAVAPCIVTIFGQQYDVSPLQTSHTGGNIFTCGTDMTAVYQPMHGTDVSRIAQYLLPAGTTVPTTSPTAIPTADPTVAPTLDPTVVPTVAPTVTPSVSPAPQRHDEHEDDDNDREESHEVRHIEDEHENELSGTQHVEVKHGKKNVLSSTSNIHISNRSDEDED